MSLDLRALPRLPKREEQERTPTSPSPSLGKEGNKIPLLPFREAGEGSANGMKVALLLLLLALAGCGGHKAADTGAADTTGGSKREAKPTVQVAAVDVAPIDQTLNVTGTLQPLPGHESKVNAPYAGTLAALYVKPNDRVARGQVVAMMSTQPLLGQERQAEATIAANKLQVEQARVNALQQEAATRSAVAQAKAAEAGAQASFEGAVRNLDRERKLYADGLVAAKDVEDAQVTVETSQATLNAQREAVAAARSGSSTALARQKDIAIAQEQVANAQGALATAHAQINLATIHAPTAGTVTTVTATSGETADPATPLLTIVDTASLQLGVSVLSSAVAQVRRGQTVRFSVESLPKRIFLGTVSSIGAQVDSTTGTVPVTIQISNTGRLLKDDTIATGQIVVKHIPDALLAPKSAVLTDPASNEASVVVVGQDNIAHARPVKTGLTIGERVQITSGVHAGERVITSGGYALPDKTEVTVQEAKAQNGS